MSDEAQPAESPEDTLLGLNALDLGPAWARGETERKKGGDGRRQRDRNRVRNERGRDRREGKQGESRREGRGPRRDDRSRRGRHEGGEDRGKRFQKGGRGRREEDRRGSRGREEVAPPKGFTAEVMPVEEGLDGLAKEILAGGRTYSVFDLAKLVLGARERFNVTFQANRDAGGLVRCKKDGSLWLDREEALRHFWRAEWRSEYYVEVVTEAAPPKGNFQAVARCGMSGEWLGPPNYHGYQPAVLQLHRERFGHMSLEAYRNKIQMERGEEAVAAWMEKMSKQTNFRPIGGESPGGEDERLAGKDGEPAEEVEESPEPVMADGPDENAASSVEKQEGEKTEYHPDSNPGEDPGVEAAGESNEDLDPAENLEDAVLEKPSGKEPDFEEEALADRREVERHFLENHFEDAYHETNRAWVSGNIRGHQLSPGLLTLLRNTVSEERRYPGKLTPILCRQLSGRHVAVFKWRRKLKAGPSRPHPVPDDIIIADRLLALLSWITENSGRKLEHLWKALLPAEVSDEDRTGWYHDLHWLLNQGYVLLMADSTIHRAKPIENEGGGAAAEKIVGKSQKVPAADSEKEKGQEKEQSGDPPLPPAAGEARQEVTELDGQGLRSRSVQPAEDETEGGDVPESPSA